MFARYNPRYRLIFGAAIALSVLLVFYLSHMHYYPSGSSITEIIHKDPEPTSNKKYIPEPEWTPPPIEDPWPALSDESFQLPAIPPWNKPKEDLYKDYGLSYAPPLFIGFTRTWPILLQAVVSYITAGWPASQIYVIENTGVQWANARGKLSLQNPFYLNHNQLKKLGVNIIQTPVLMNFAQLQNFYTHLGHEHDWPYYFWSHMDVLTLSYEDGEPDVTPKAGEAGYKTVYELCLQELNRTTSTGERWGNKFFAYDHLTLVNRDAYDDVGGWDSFIPFYINDCDMHTRLTMRNWTQKDVRVGIITDTSTVLNDFSAFYRIPGIEPDLVDPNPPDQKKDSKRDLSPRDEEFSAGSEVNHLEYWNKLRMTADRMFHYKHGERGRNTWQLGQRGGQGEPFYYPARGIKEAQDVLTGAGKDVYRRKWGRDDCDLIGGGKLVFDDQWKVESS